MPLHMPLKACVINDSCEGTINQQSLGKTLIDVPQPLFSCDGKLYDYTSAFENWKRNC